MNWGPNFIGGKCMKNCPLPGIMGVKHMGFHGATV